MSIKTMFDHVRTSLRDLARRIPDTELRKEAFAIDWQLKHKIELAEEALEEAKMIGARNPAFDGDMVGWLDDDFTYEGTPYEPPDKGEVKRLLELIHEVKTLVETDVELQRKYKAIMSRLEVYARYAEKTLKYLDDDEADNANKDA